MKYQSLKSNCLGHNTVKDNIWKTTYAHPKPSSHQNLRAEATREDRHTLLRTRQEHIRKRHFNVLQILAITSDLSITLSAFSKCTISIRIIQCVYGGVSYINQNYLVRLCKRPIPEPIPDSKNLEEALRKIAF